MTSAELLELFNDLAGRSANDTITPTKKYTWLARAEKEVVSELASVAPWTLYQKVSGASLPTMATDDSNVFTFGTNGGANIEPFGRVQIYRRLTDIPDRPLIEGVDYLSEGDQVRLPRGRTITSPLYWRGIVMPAAIAANEAPHLIPTDANELTAIRAAKNFAESGNLRNAALADRMRLRWKERWPYWCLLWRQQFASGGVLLSMSARDLVTPLL